jgi:hypothetical protein
LALEVLGVAVLLVEAFSIVVPGNAFAATA